MGKDRMDETDRSPPGRTSRQELRREEILSAARDVFFASGFAGASVDAVIARIGGSKRTIYAYFGNKEQLFATVVEEISRRAMGSLAEDDGFHPELEATLQDMGRRYIAVILSPDALQLYRTVVAEGSRFPQLAKVFFETGPGRASANLAQAFERMATRWGLHGQDHQQLAEHFLGMIRDDLHLKVVLGLHPHPTPAEAEASVAAAVALFLHGAVAAKR